jgi:plastocyanin
MRWRRTVLIVLTLTGALVLPACGGGGNGAGSGAGHTVLVDYNHDEFAGSFLAYFPRSVSVHPGDTVTFKQAWTGEPHSVTMGTLTDGLMREVLPLFEKYPNSSGEEVKAQHPEDYAIYERVCLEGGKLPLDENATCPALPDMASFGGPDIITMNQNGAQPCFLDSGSPPLDKNKPCPRRAQPAFNGRQSYYSSGFIHYEGAQGNTYKITLSNDIKPGNYQYYCNLHGPGMSGAIEVKPKTASVPSQSSVDREARREIEKMATPMLKAFKQARAGNVKLDGKPFKGNLTGYGVEDQNFEGFISEFFPNPIKAKVGEKVTWRVDGHTVSFDVPRYFPIATVAKNGKVTFNPRAVKPINSPVAQFPQGGGGGGPGQSTPPVDVDAGTWDGRSFISSGNPESAINWSLTFTKAGKYKYACLIHPRMVGEVDVSG